MAAEALDNIVTASAKLAEGTGFRRRRLALIKDSGNAVAAIEFQKSQQSTRDETIFTVNLIVVHRDLDHQSEINSRKSEGAKVHFCQRIGILLPGRPNKWWSVARGVPEEKMASEISNLIVEKAIPYVTPYLDLNVLVALWKSGQSPGLTEKQRTQYLAQASAMRKGT